MSLSDPIADMLTRIRNASRSGKKDVLVKASKVCEGIACVLKDEGYIQGYDLIDDNKQGLIRITLKYTLDGTGIISEIKRVSTPGRRVYSNAKEIPNVLGGLGITVVSTNRGVFSDRVCREENVGGQLLCQVS